MLLLRIGIDLLWLIIDSEVLSSYLLLKVMDFFFFNNFFVGSVCALLVGNNEVACFFSKYQYLL